MTLCLRALRRRAFLCVALLVSFGCGSGSSDDGGTGPTPDPNQLPLEHYDAGFFSIDKPRGWTVTLAGRCSEFAFLLRDPQNPLWQIFYFGTVGPVYTSQAQKDIDEWYVAHGGFAIPWLDAPVIDPLTPDNFLAHWPEIANMDAAVAFMPGLPTLNDLALFGGSPQAAMLPGASTGNARGLFSQSDAIGEGMFLATVKVFYPFNGNPAAGNAFGNFVCGVTAPKEKFAASCARLVQSLESFMITQSYVDDCIAQQQQIWGAIASAGRTLSEASDILWEGWQQRSHTEDIGAEKWSDAYRGVERVYDPFTGEVYEFPLGWYDDYNLQRNNYEMSNLQPLPADDWNLWMRAVEDGPSALH